MSVSRMSTVSQRPRLKPENSPIAVPSTTVMTAVTNALSSTYREPVMTRASTSLPWPSVPNQCWALIGAYSALVSRGSSSG